MAQKPRLSFSFAERFYPAKRLFATITKHNLAKPGPAAGGKSATSGRSAVSGTEYRPWLAADVEMASII